MHRNLVFLAALIAIGGAPVSAQKGKPSSPVNPEIGFTYASGNYMDLRLANENGTGAVTLHRGAFGSLGQFDLGPRTQMQIAFTENRDLKLLTYEPTGNGSLRTVGVDVIYDGPLSVDALSFSNDGSKIAFFGSSATDNQIMIYDVGSRTISPLTSGDYAATLAWYHDGSGLVYRTAIPHVGYAIKEVMLDGSLRQLLQEPNIEHVDTARTSKDLLVSYSRPGIDEIRVGRWSDGSYQQERVVAGLLAHFNCLDTRFIYRGFARMKRPTYKYTYSSNSSSTFSTDSNVHHTDWMPTC